MPAWKGFERLAEKIFAELHAAAEVKWNDFILGAETETERQIDVSIRWRSGDDEYLTIVQARDKKRPADINTVGEFLSVMRDVGASGGALVCRGGFTKSAHTYAKNRGVALYNLHDASSVAWSRKLTIPILWSELTPVFEIRYGLHLNAGDSIPTNDPLGLPMTSDAGATRLNPVTTFERLWNGPEARREPGAAHSLVPDQAIEIRVRDAIGRERWEPGEVVMHYTVECKSWLGHFEPAACRGLIDYLDEQTFTASYLPLSEIPVQRDAQWRPIAKPDEVVVKLRGTIVSSVQVIQVSGGRVGQLAAQLVEPDQDQPGVAFAQSRY